MARVITLLMPDGKTSILIGQISRTVAYENGVGIFNLRDRMIGWIACSEPVAVQIVALINEMQNNPHRAKTPNWSTLLAEETEAGIEG